MSEEHLSEVFCEIMNLAEKMNVANIGALDGCWEPSLPDEWFVAVNGHKEKTACSRGAVVGPFAAYFERRGMPVGVVGPMHGVVAGASVEDEIIAVLRKAQGEVAK